LGAFEVRNENGTPVDYQPKSEVGRKRKRGGDKNKKSAKKPKTREELLEEREIDEEENTYAGTVRSYKPKKDFGFIAISGEITFKDLTVKEKIFVMKDDIICYSDEVGLTEGSEVTFKIYKDSKGLGAWEVMNVDGTPMEYPAQSKKSQSAESEEVTMKVAGKGRRRKKKET